jgi:hypothetical protein
MNSRINLFMIAQPTELTFLSNIQIQEFARRLGDYFNRLSCTSDFKVWTSWLKRAIDTAQYIDAVQER